MARRYVKPAISFQRLDMSASLSAGCALSATFAEMDCPVMIPEWGETVFTERNCDLYGDEFICYHVSAANSNVFGS
ncbi:MAG: hypothetical protein IJK64_09870 [Clostridia bacterium]|nr:hypothetical protein [Clostridia bacterium]